MKTNLFIYSITERKISKTYGGTTYFFNVYQVLNNDINFVAAGEACTRGHKGEESEAFGVLIQAMPEIKKMLIRNAKKVLKTDPQNYNAKSLLKDVENSGGYYFRYFENFGLRLKSV